MAIGIIMQGIGGILLGIANFVSNRCLRVLVPLGGTHKNQVVGVFANHRNHLVGVILDSTPSNVSGFIEQLKNHMVIFTVSLCHFFEEALGRFGLFVCIVRMPVDNHVDVVLDSRFDNGLHQVLLRGRIAAITLVAVTPVFVAGRHGRTNNLDVHVANHGSNAFFTPEFDGLRHQTPVKAHAAHLYFGAIFNTFATAINTALPLRVLAGHELSILAHRTHASRSHCERGRNKTRSEHAQAQHFCIKSDCHISSDTPIFATKFRLLGVILHVISST